MIKRITIYNTNGTASTYDLGEEYVFAHDEDIGKIDVIESFEVISTHCIAIKSNGVRAVICGLPFKTIETEDKKDENDIPK